MARILIVDDSPIIHRLLSVRLRSAGHEILAFGKDGNEGVTLFTDLSPDLVLLDVTMPNCDGREALRRMMAISNKAKVVMLSAIADPEIIKECLSNGATDFLSKDRLSESGYLESVLAKLYPKIAA